MYQIGGKKVSKLNLFFRKPSNAECLCLLFAFTISQTAQALKAKFPREVCGRCVDHCQHLDLLLCEDCQRESCCRLICDTFCMIAFCCGNWCERILCLYTTVWFYFILIWYFWKSDLFITVFLCNSTLGWFWIQGSSKPKKYCFYTWVLSIATL